MEGVRVVSMNVNGLNIPSKRHIIFDHIRRSKADVILLQETHATLASEKLWRSEWGGPAFFCNGSQSSRGVAILVIRDLAFHVVDQKEDENGRILCMDLQIKGTVYTFCSLYAPTQDKSCEQLETLGRVEHLLGELSAVNTIVGGDFNCFLDPSLDRNSPGPAPLTPMPTGIKSSPLWIPGIYVIYGGLETRISVDTRSDVVTMLHG